MSILGLDIGTTGVKAVAFTREGKFLASAYREYNLLSPQEGALELDPRDVLEGAREAIGEVNEATRNDPIQSMATSTMGEAAVPVDADGKPVGNAIIGFDARGQEEAEAFRQRISHERVFEITGHGINPYHTLFKVMWRRRHDPETFRRARRYLCFGDFVMASLGLPPRIDPSMAARTLAFDIHRRQWSGEILAAADLEDIFAEPIDPGAPVGEVAADNVLGLPAGCVVAGGLHDQPAGVLGSGIEPGESMLATGTVVCLGVRLLEEPDARQVAPMRDNKLCYYPTFGKDQWIAIAWNFTGGSLLKWFRDQLGAAECAEAGAQGVDPYDVICGNLPADPTNVFVLPHFTTAGTPHLDPRALGAIFGLRLTTTRAEIARAILEGIAYELVLNADLMKASGVEIQRYKAIGGAAKSPPWMQIYADTLDRPVVVLDVTEGAALGAALLGARGAGLAESDEEVYEIVDRVAKEGRVFEPDPEAARRYRERFEIYRELYTTNRDLTHRIYDLAR